VPEVIADGVSGFIVETIDEAVDAVGRLHEISREGCRASFESRFTVERMASNYVEVYQRLIGDGAESSAAFTVGAVDVPDSTDILQPMESQGP
jgi:hypothetical protein